MTHPDPDPDHEADIAAIRDEMCKPLSREQIVANELWMWIDLNGPAQWEDDDWLRLARHIIKVVEVACNISAEEVATAMNSPPRHPIPKLDELGD